MPLEEKLIERLADDRHLIVTLVGRGGIGKTSLAVHVLRQLAQSERFEAVLWFSARDIDLLPQGPKLVKPPVLTVEDVAAEFVRLMDPAEASEKGFRKLQYLSAALSKSPVGPMLFVFDNFETLRNPVEFYEWLDTYIRPPNKILITTRFRDFKGDYPVEVTGMTESEFDRLVDATADTLGITAILTKEYRNELYSESEGHPYVAKVLLGEVAKSRRLVKIERIVATQDDILDALFERTYSSLSPAGQRVFLTLCNWRSTIPQLALEAVLLRPSNDTMDVTRAVEEVIRTSLVEAATSPEDSEVFLSVPLPANLDNRNLLGHLDRFNPVEVIPLLHE